MTGRVEMKTKRAHRPGLIVMIVGLALMTIGCSRVESRVGKRVATAASERMAGVFVRDEARDAASRIVRLTKPRRVFRYVTPAETKIELRAGLRRGSHFTSRAVRGRPPYSATAADRYGLGPGRTRRLTATLPEGTPVRLNKAINGAAGVGEVRIERRLPPTAIDRIVSLPPGP
jgi:hypothetical protein